MNALDKLNKVISAWEGYKTNPSTAKLEISGETLIELRDALEEAKATLRYIADYSNYASDGDIRDTDGVIMHVSDFANKYGGQK